MYCAVADKSMCSHAEMWAKFNLPCWKGTCTSAAVNPAEKNVFGMWALITAQVFSHTKMVLSNLIIFFFAVVCQ